jgi:hypothetical protein
MQYFLKGEKMKKQIVRILILLALVFSPLMPVTQARAEAVEQADFSQDASLEELLNPDGTLNLDGNFSGALDIAGYSVQMDPLRGPVFGPANVTPQVRAGVANPGVVAQGQWGSLGGGGAVFNNGLISAVAVHGSYVYVGGDFQNANSIPAADFVARWDGTAWSALGGSGDGDGSITYQDWWTGVYALAVDAAGNLYVGGSFSDIDANGVVLTAADNIARWDGTSWHSLGDDGAGNGPVSGEVYDIEVSGSDVYVGGYFNDVNNNGVVLNAADYVARWNSTQGSWFALGGDDTGDGSLKDGVYSLAVSGSNVYVGGQFTNVKNNATTLTAADYIAKWDGGNWSAMGGTNLNEGAFNGAVYALAVDASGNVYAGGEFTNVRGGLFTILTADYIAKWNGASWSNLGSNGVGNGSLQTSVSEIAVSAAGDVYVCGSFVNVNNGGSVLGAADGIVKWNGSGWSALGSDGAGNGALHTTYGVFALAVSGTQVYAVGGFSYANNGGTLVPQAAGIAQWNGSNWSALGTGTNGSLNGAVYAIAVKGTDVYVGGTFTNVMDQGVVFPAADYIVKWDGMHWSALGSNGAGDGALNGQVTDILIDGSNVYVTGSFTDVNNNGSVLNAADRLAMWDGSNWSALGSGAGGSGAITDAIGAMATKDGDLYVGGWFENVAGISAADFIAKWDGVNWSALGSNGAGEGSLTVSVNALAFYGPDLFVSGQFQNANNNGQVLTAADYLAKWDGANWSAVSSNGSGGSSFTCPPWTLAVNGSALYAGGCFTNVNDNGTSLDAADYVAKWDGVHWSALGSSGVGNGSISDVVDKVVVNGSNVYVSGRFINVNNNGTVLSAADNIVRWNGTNWVALGSDGTGNGSVQRETGAMAVGGATLYVGGDFIDVNNNGNILEEADYLAVHGIPTIFADVPETYWAWQHIERLYGAGITGGCTTIPLNYCPETPVTRAQMAVFLLVAKHGAGYTPPPASGLFSDVPIVGNGYAAWIEQMASEGITGGCGGGNFCPNAPVTREQMAVFLLVAEHGTGYTPPPAAGLFSDVPASNGFAKWIEQLAAEGITGGCGGGKFCPKTSVTRAQMAVFLVAAFNLP